MEIEREFTRLLTSRLDERLNFIQVVIGPRQVGKTTGLRQIADKWHSPVHIASADEMAPPSTHWIDQQWRIAGAMGDGAVLVIDEVQKVPGWSTAVKRLSDAGRRERRLNVVLLGSASLTLQQGLSESLAGRYELIHAGHWTLAECREAFGWDLDTWLKFGGYPAAAELIHDVPRWQSFLRDSIIEPVLLKDLLGMTAIGKPALFRQTFELALSFPAQEISLQKMLGQLQDSGNVTTIKHYLDVFEGAFLIKALQKYSGSIVRQRGSSPKLVPLNNALIHAVRDPREVHATPDWRGRLFEAAVGAALCASDHQVTYWRDGRHEVDYVVEAQDALYAVEVKSGRTRRVGGLAAFLKRYPAAVPALIDRQRGERLLEGEPLDSIVSSGADRGE